MLDGITDRVQRARRIAARATVLPLLIRGGIGMAFLLALVVAWSETLVLGRAALPLALMAAYPMFAPRGIAPTAAALAVVAGWILDTTWYDAPIALWRVLAIATLLYLGHTLAALAAVLPYDAVVGAEVAGNWLLRAGGVVLGSAVLTVIVLGVSTELTGPAFLLATVAGLAAAVGLALLLARLLRRT
ncbi:hypothetical protein [Actinoplanes sp. NPDC051859]|uniref:hypothetical protein n=1 Tax=Actinoplanes sp. NPDC051859 TaxID=3363909 RepID=UPI0037BB450D